MSGAGVGDFPAAAALGKVVSDLAPPTQSDSVQPGNLTMVRGTCLLVNNSSLQRPVGPDPSAAGWTIAASGTGLSQWSGDGVSIIVTLTAAHSLNQGDCVIISGFTGGAGQSALGAYIVQQTHATAPSTVSTSQFVIGLGFGPTYTFTGTGHVQPAGNFPVPTTAITSMTASGKVVTINVVASNGQAHNLVQGDYVTISGVVGLTNVNGTWPVTNAAGTPPGGGGSGWQSFAVTVTTAPTGSYTSGGIITPNVIPPYRCVVTVKGTTFYAVPWLTIDPPVAYSGITGTPPTGQIYCFSQPPQLYVAGLISHYGSSAWTNIPWDTAKWAPITYGQGGGIRQPQYRLMGDTVEIRGVIQNVIGISGGSDVLCTLPVGFRPKSEEFFAITWNNLGGSILPGFLAVQSDGQVIIGHSTGSIGAGGQWYLSGIEYSTLP